MRRVIVAAVSFAAVLVGTVGVATADTRAASPREVQVFGPFPNWIQCLQKQAAVDDGGWKITAPCHSSAAGKWWFKAER